MISVITACTRPALLAELLPVVEAQRGEREWIVQLDGDAIAARRQIAERLAGREWITLRANERPAGSAVSRNTALLAARGDFVLCVDDDDLLYRDSIHALEHALHSEPRAFGACGEARVFDGDPAAARAFKSWPAAGTVAPGTIRAEFDRTGRIPLHVGACLWRRECLVSVGGFAALPRSIDTAPFLACEAVRPVVYVDEPIYLYRSHSDQMTRGGAYRQSREEVHSFVSERAELLARMFAAARP
jgi:glycosyltransferase involved in cell wall biosynthesis